LIARGLAAMGRVVPLIFVVTFQATALEHRNFTERPSRHVWRRLAGHLRLSRRHVQDAGFLELIASARERLLPVGSRVTPNFTAFFANVVMARIWIVAAAFRRRSV
jgi:hypothetical protein